MVRNFDPSPLAEDAIERMLRNGARAPSAGFTQGFEFLVLTEAKDREQFWNAAWPPSERGESRRVTVMSAPLVIVPCANKQAYLDRYAEQDKGWVDRDESRWPIPYWTIDTAFATMAMLLTATDADIGALFFSLAPHQQRVSEAMRIPFGFEPIGAIAAGRAAQDEPSPSLSRGRRPLQSVVHRGSW